MNENKKKKKLQKAATFIYKIKTLTEKKNKTNWNKLSVASILSLTASELHLHKLVH